MNRNRSVFVFVCAAVTLILLVFHAPVAIGAQGDETGAAATITAVTGTGLTYQGRLVDGGMPANGVYDFRFLLWAEETKTTLLGKATPTWKSLSKQRILLRR